MSLPPEVAAELSAATDVLVAAGVDRAMARQKVWQDYQAELITLAGAECSVAERAVPELPPPKYRSTEDLARNGNKPIYQPRTDSGDGFWTPERKAKSQSELDKLKQQLGIRPCQTIT